MIAQLKSLTAQSLALPANWLSEALGDGIMDSLFDETDVLDPFTILSISTNPDDVMSSIGSLMKYSSEGGRAFNRKLIEFINKLDEFRWIELIGLREDVACDCIHMFELLERAPTEFLLDAIAPMIEFNSTAVETFATIWFEHKWDVSLTVLFIIQSSSTAWKYLLPLHSEIEFENSSHSILYRIAYLNDKQKQNHLYALLSTNGSCLHHLLKLDEENASGISSTFATVNGFDVWDYVLTNPAADPLIEYALDHFWLVKTGFYTRESLRRWIVSRLGSNPNSYKYITREDVLTKVLNRSFYMTLGAIPLIESFVMLDIEDPERYIDDRIIQGLIAMAMSHNPKMALKAIKVIDEGLQFDELSDVDWLSLADSIHGLQFVKRKLKSLDMSEYLLNILREANLMPYLVSEYSYCHGEYDEIVKISNLDRRTVQNLTYDVDLCVDIGDNALELDYCDWNILVQSRIGVLIAITNIDYVINQGSLPFLLKSPFLMPADIKELINTTSMLEYCADEELASLLDREDAYEPNLTMIANAKHGLCLEIVALWFQPDRLNRIAVAHDMTIRSYLQAVA